MKIGKVRDGGDADRDVDGGCSDIEVVLGEGMSINKDRSRY